MKSKETYFYRGSWLQLVRPFTLTATISPIVIVTGLVPSYNAYSVLLFIMFIICSCLIQATINMLNDYFDFLQGQDDTKWTLNKDESLQKITLKQIKVVSNVLMLIALLGGVYFIFMTNVAVFLIGFFSVLAGVFYSAGKKPLASLALGEVTAFICLGMVVPILAYYIQTNVVTKEIIFIAFIYGILIVTMILTNNICDIEKDRPFRKTLAILLGQSRAINLLICLYIILYITVFMFIYLHMFFWPIISTIFAIPFAVQVIKYTRKTNYKYEAMKYAAFFHISFSVLLAVVVWAGSSCL